MNFDKVGSDITSRVGAIYPVMPKHFERLLSGRTIFCKFGRLFTGTVPGSVIVFYESGGKLVGESPIRSISRLTPSEAIRRFGERLFLDKNELEAYSMRWKRPPNTEMLVFELRDIRRYPVPLQITASVPPAGRPLTQEIYEAIISKRKMAETLC